MSRYLYDDEDNAPMLDNVMPEDPVLKYTTYSSKMEMVAADRGEALPFTDPPDGCWNCQEFDGDHCTKNWNNLDPSYYNPDTDDVEPDDRCDEWTLDESAVWEDYHGTDT